jgi:hypothetical protein
VKRLKREAEEKSKREAEEARIQKEEDERRKKEEAEERRRNEEERRLEERRQRERREREEREREEMAEGVAKYGLEGGGSVELNKKLVKTLSALEESRQALRETEEALDDASKRAKTSAKRVKAQDSELLELKARYNSQRLINAKLMLEIQSLKGNIQVCCRIRPFNKTETDRGDEAAVELITESEVRPCLLLLLLRRLDVNVTTVLQYVIISDADLPADLPGRRVQRWRRLGDLRLRSGVATSRSTQAFTAPPLLFLADSHLTPQTPRRCGGRKARRRRSSNKWRRWR